MIGGGSGGLTVAAGAAQLGARTVLFERGEMGGDCLNYGCVPSKTLIASSRMAHRARNMRDFGIATGPVKIDFTRVADRIRKTITAIAPHDSQSRFEGLGVTVIRSTARFISPNEVDGGDVRVKARRIVIATGSRPFIPPIPNLETVPYLTNETIFEHRLRPFHLLIIGGGPIGVELGQAFQRLGTRVTLVEANRILGSSDPEHAQIVRQSLVSDGLTLLEGTTIAGVRWTGAEVIASTSGAAGCGEIRASHLLVATGRTPRLADLDLDAGGVAYSAKGVSVDRRLRTSNRRVYALGDVIGGPQFTHAAAYQAGIVLGNVLFALRRRADYSALPSVTFSDPELAEVGLREAAARARFAGVTVARAGYPTIDRAVTDGEPTGMVKVIIGRRGRILGASIVGHQAGELVQVWTLAIGQRLRARQVASMISPYPTFGDINKKAITNYYGKRLFSKWPRRVATAIRRLVP
ncbi:MAG: NAD(P)/FAD-dependent oxidoreductase [Geminicoccaceae bacterium]